MNPVIVRNLKIGEGIPKICVPIVRTTKSEIVNEAKIIQKSPADMVEWRGDWFEDIFQFPKVEEVCKELRAVFENTPILFTFRRKQEGGEKEIETNGYGELLQKVAETGLVEVIDIEGFAGDQMVKETIEKVHGAGVKVIVSNHDFHETPNQEELVRRLEKMRGMGADITKIAVMPKNKKDVLTLLCAVEELSSRVSYPMIAVSMSDMGMITRISGEVFGSAVTFGAAQQISAPGQIEVNKLRDWLLFLHKSSENI
ncbi:MAG: type I 3-dehydroquinate dehydratase [Lachnospiraceae bacterium]